MKIKDCKSLLVVGILGLLNTDCALNAFLAPSWFYQESVTREIHRV